MVECGACARVFLNGAGEEYDPPHCCVTCKVALHSMINDLGCCPWMPVDNYYFCSRNCIEKHNAAVVEAASIESREPGDTEPFGPDGEPGEWADWLEDNPDKYFPLRRRPDAEVENDIPDKEEQPPTPRHTLLARELLKEGARVQESFRMTAEDEEGLFYGGVVGPLLAGSYSIGYDDGDMTGRTSEEVRHLVETGRFSACTTHTGLIAGQNTPIRADRLSTMQCGRTSSVPVGVLLTCTNDPDTAMYSNLFHSHCVCADAVRAAVSSKGRSTQPARAAARQPQTEDMLGYHTFRRGDVVGYIAGADNEYCEEIVFGVKVFNDGQQQRRYLITFNPTLQMFSVGAWTSWRRTQAAAGVGIGGDPPEFNPEDNDLVNVVGDEVVTAMAAAWPSSHLQSFTTKDKVKNAAKLGPATLQKQKADDHKKRTQGQRAQQRKVQKLKAEEKLKEDTARAERERAESERLERKRADSERDREQRATEARARADRERAALECPADRMDDSNFILGLLERETPQRPRETQLQLVVPPPPPLLWQEARTEDGRAYFWNTSTRETRWILPDSTPSPSELVTNTESRFARASPQAHRLGIRTMKRNHFVLSRELHEVVEPIARQRIVRELATIEVRLQEQGISI
jgi:hypothetical protein